MTASNGPVASSEPLIEGAGAPRDEVICQICGEAIDEVDAVRCAACGTPHHRRCWDWTGGCSTYGCGSTRLHATPERAERPNGSAALPIAAGLSPARRERAEAPWPIPSSGLPELSLAIPLAMAATAFPLLFLPGLGFEAFGFPFLALWAGMGLLFPLALTVAPYRCAVDLKERALLQFRAHVFTETPIGRWPIDHVAFVAVLPDTRGIPVALVPGSHFATHRVVAVFRSGARLDLSLNHASPVDARRLGKKVATLVGCPCLHGEGDRELELLHGPSGAETRLREIPPWMSVLTTPLHVATSLFLALLTGGIFLAGTVLPWCALWVHLVRRLSVLVTS